MSRAFAPGESADDGERYVIKPSVLPPGTPNYITPAGVRMLEAERDRLLDQKKTLSKSFDDEQRSKMLARQFEQLNTLLQSVRVIDPASQPKDKVLFGASVAVQNTTGKEDIWRIVGVDETDLEKGWISWISPLARALLEKKVGEIAAFGSNRLTILRISYDRRD